MLKNEIQRLSVVFFLMLVVGAFGYARQVLFISSYSENFLTVDQQKKGIHEVLDKNNVSLDIEYMDMKQYNTVENENNFYESLKYKLAHHSKYDAILLGDDAALHFAQKYQNELFNKIPMVFFCVNDIETARAAGENPYITGAVEEFYLKETVDVALKFQPSTKRIISLYDDTLTGKGDYKQFQSLQSEFPNYTFEGIDSSLYTYEEYAKQLEKIASDSVVIYQDCFEDVNGNQYTIPESVKFITEHIKVPVYRTSIGGVGNGLLGGKMVSYDESGRKAASIIMEILNGASISDIPVVTKGESRYYFDYFELKKFKINESLVPHDAIILNKAPSFYDQYKSFLIPVIVVILVFVFGIIIALYDNMRQRKYSEGMKYLAEHDMLTNLPNRRAIKDKLAALVSSGVDVTVILLDVDDFKEINDSEGHACGDAILVEISQRLLVLMESEHFFSARFGGDEFILIIEDINPVTLNRLLANIRDSLLRPIVFQGKKFYIRTSMGISDNKNTVQQPSELISNADLALYYIKGNGKNACAYYNIKMKQDLIEKKEIERLLTSACLGDGFTIMYQPQVCMTTGKTYCYEALIRLKENSMSPAKFIPVAEETDMIQNIGRIVTDKVIDQLSTWRDLGIPLHPVSINFSSNQVRDKEYVNYLKKKLEVNNIPSEMIEVEITENILLKNNDRAMKLLSDFSSMGINLALDDFGTGYSSISYLTYMPVKKIKLDKSLVDIYLQNGKDSLIENIIRLTHSLGLKITVEGIETENQFERLRSFACDYVQGYYYCRPVSGDEIVNKKFY